MLQTAFLLEGYVPSMVYFFHTIFEFLGILKKEDGTPVAPLKLAKPKYLGSLEGVTWGPDNLLRGQELLVEDENPAIKILESPQRLLIKRARINVNIILKENDENIKYELFQRLNTGGSSLSDQELRNCILVSINRGMFDWLVSLSSDENFLNCVNLTDRAANTRYDMELALRFLIFRNLALSEIKNIDDLDEFLTDQMMQKAESKDFDQEKEAKYFRETFELLAKSMGANSFRKYDVGKIDLQGGSLFQLSRWLLWV